MAVDSLVEAARAAAEARSSTSSSSDDEYESRKQQQQQLPLQYGLEPSRVVGLNPSNVVVKSFADVALADLELVFPSKKVREEGIGTWLLLLLVLWSCICAGTSAATGCSGRAALQAALFVAGCMQVHRVRGQQHRVVRRDVYKDTFLRGGYTNL